MRRGFSQIFFVKMVVKTTMNWVKKDMWVKKEKSMRGGYWG